MFLLEKDNYSKVITKIKDNLNGHILALGICEGNNPGEIYVDDLEEPNQICIFANFPLCMIAGDYKNEDKFSEMMNFVALQGESKLRYEFHSPEALNLFHNRYPADKIVTSYGCSHSLNFEKYNKFIMKDFYNNSDISVLKMNKSFFQKYHDEEIINRLCDVFGLVNKYLENGIGFAVIKNGIVVSRCYSSCMTHNKLSIDIATKEEYRKMNYATIAAVNFINECKNINKNPVWDCISDNTRSLNFAKKLGFELAHKIGIYNVL